MAAKILQSTCALDCPDACSLLVTVDSSGAEPRATRLRGNPEHPVTRGFLCAKVSRYLDREYSPDRLLYPQKRVGAKGEGRFERIGWDEAIETVASRLQAIAAEHGSESILPYSYAGTMGYLQGSSMDRRFFHRLGASRLDRTICSAAGGQALMNVYGARIGTDPEQYANARLIIAWGANIMGTSVHNWPFIVEARRQGAKFYTIDPVRNRTGHLSDRHYFINPGTDLALALAMMHVIFAERLEDRDYMERFTSGGAALREHVRDFTPAHAADLTGIPADDIAALAREYAATKPALIRANYGPQRSERGGAAISAIAMLPAITGAWRQVGGGLTLTTSGAFTLDRTALERPDLQRLSPAGGPTRMLNMSSLGAALNEVSDPPVKALVVYNSNPAAIAPNQNAVFEGLSRRDLFTVVLEQFQTDTADYADILLPATTFLEHTDIYFAYGHYYLQLARPALPAPGDCKPNVEVFRLLAERMGFTDTCFADTDDDMIRQALASGHPNLSGITIERLEQEHSVRLNLSALGQPFQPFAEGGFATADGRCKLDPAGLAYEPPVESRHGDVGLRQAFPLEFVSPKNDDSMNSTFGYQPRLQHETATLHMHTSDAEERGISTGDSVRVFNGRGGLILRAEVDGIVRQGVVSAASVGWAKLAASGRNANALTSERLTDIGAGPTFYSCLVQVERCGD